MKSEDRDRRVLALYEKVLEIEQRLIPTGLHTFGKPNTTAEISHLLTMVASFERPELGLPSLTDLIANGLGLSSYAQLLKESETSEKRMAEREVVESLARETVNRLLEQDEHSEQEAADWINQRAGVPTHLALEILPS